MLVLLVLFKAALSVLDTFTDVYFCATCFSDGNTGWGAMSLVILIVSAVSGQNEHRRSKDDVSKRAARRLNMPPPSSTIGIFMTLIHLGDLHQAVQVLRAWSYVRSQQLQEGGSEDSEQLLWAFNHYQTSHKRAKLNEAIIEGALQTMLRKNFCICTFWHGFNS